MVEDGVALRTQIDYREARAGGASSPPASRSPPRGSATGCSSSTRTSARASRAQAIERRYGAVLEATSDWVSIADRDNNLLYVNPAGRRMVGMDLDEDITGRRVGDFSPAWARERVLGEGSPPRAAMARGARDLARLHRDGHEIPVSQVIVAQLADDGEVDFYATIARDMTRERAAEAALRESEERFRVTFEQAPIGVSLIDPEGRFLQVNDAYCRTVGRSRDELLQLGPEAITHPDDVADTRHAFSALADGIVPTVRFEKRYVDARGESVWVEMSGSVLRDDAGRPQYFMGMVQDLGERRVAHTLQRSMLTTQLPDVDGVELAVRYLPGTRQTEISGDWYDVIPLPDGRVGVVIGDVVGRGIEAAATMSQLRTALRAYAVEGLEPAAVVAKLHRLVDHLRVGLSTTLVYLDFDPFTREVRYVSAGPPAGGARARRCAAALPAGRTLDAARRGAGRRSDPPGADRARAGRRRPALHRRPRRAPRRRHRQPPAAAARGRRRGARRPAGRARPSHRDARRRRDPAPGRRRAAGAARRAAHDRDVRGGDRAARRGARRAARATCAPGSRARARRRARRATC